MANRIKDTDYLAISARVRAMENSLLTRERMEQILEARSDEEAAKILQECGYPALDAAHPEEMDRALSDMREATFADLAEGAPDSRYIDIFRLKYDYHNVKTILKAEAMSVNPDHMLMDMGRIPAEELKEAIYNGKMETLPECLADAVVEAREVLNTTRDSQLSDIVLDRWYFRDMEAVAAATGSDFLQGYVRVQIDAVNLRSLVRTLRMGKNTDFLQGILFEGGEVDMDSIVRAGSGGSGGIADLYAPTVLHAAAEAGVATLQGGPMTDFEKLCDDAVADYLSGAQMVPFGEAPLLAFLAARETEYTNIRILLMGRSTGLSGDVIRARLRNSYV